MFMLIVSTRKLTIRSKKNVASRFTSRFILCFIFFFFFSDRDTQMKRLMERNNFSQSEAEQRINAQMSLEEKCKRATYVIDNSSSRERTGEQVKKLCEKFNRSYAYLPLRVFSLCVVCFVVWLLVRMVKLYSWQWIYCTIDSWKASRLGKLRCYEVPNLPIFPRAWHDR